MGLPIAVGPSIDLLGNCPLRKHGANERHGDERENRRTS